MAPALVSLAVALAPPLAGKVESPSPLGLSAVVAVVAAAVIAAGVVATVVALGVVAAAAIAVSAAVVVIEPPAAAAGDGRFTARNSVGSGGRTLFNFRGLGSVADNAAAASATPPSLPPLNVNPGV